MTDSPVTKTAEQVAADALNDLWPNETVNGADWIAESHEAVTIAGSFRKAGLLASDVPSGAAFFEAAKAERATHEGRGWTAEHDRKQGAAHPLRLALDYLANGKSVKAGALVYAALDLLASGAPSEEQIERTPEFEAIEQDLFKHQPVLSMSDGRISGCQCLDRVFVKDTEDLGTHLAEVFAALAGVGSPVPVQVDEAKLASVIRGSYANEQGLKIRDDLRTAKAISEWLRSGAQ